MSFLFLLFFSFANAESLRDQGDKAISLKFGFAQPKLGLEFEDKNQRGERITLAPNAPSRAFVGLSYKWIGLTMASALPVSLEDQRLKGPTTANDWQLRFNFKQWILEGVYQQYKGYYVENSDKFQLMTNETPSIQFPELVTERSSFTVSYLTHPDDFSMSAAFDQSVQQIQSGWSWIYTVSFGSSRFTTPTSLIPLTATGTYGDFEKIRGARLYSAMAGGGLGGTYVFTGPWYATGVLSAVFGMEHQDVQRTDLETSNSLQTSETHVKFGFGYNGDKFVSGIGAHIATTNSGIENAKVAFSTTAFGMYLGTRIFF